MIILCRDVNSTENRLEQDKNELLISANCMKTVEKGLEYDLLPLCYLGALWLIA